MNKQKAKNITFGVSIALNILGSLLIGGSLIHACNSPASPENVSSSVSSASAGKLDGLIPRNAPVGYSLAAGTYTFNSFLDFDLVPVGGGTYNFPFYYVTGGRRIPQTGMAFSPVPAGGGGGNLAPRKVAGEDYYFTFLPAGIVYDNLAGWYSGTPATIIVKEDQEVGSFLLSWITNNATLEGGSASSSEVSTSEGSASSDVSSSSGEEASSATSATSPDVYETIKVPENFWGYRVLNGSPDSNTGGAFVSNEISDIWSGGVRLRGPSFYLGDNATEYNGVEFYYWNFYGRDFVNEKGEIVRASSDGFKNVLYLDHVSVHPATSSDYDDASTWQVIGSAIYGMNDSGSLYVNAHGFNWLDASYKTFRVKASSVNALPYLAYSGQASASFVNPIIKNSLTISEAFRLSLTGTSADVSGGITIGGNGYTDVFSLIGSAFSSLVPILSVQVLPYLTIGTLLLVPLIVLVIFAILKVLNK